MAPPEQLTDLCSLQGPMSASCGEPDRLSSLSWMRSSSTLPNTMQPRRPFPPAAPRSTRLPVAVPEFRPYHGSSCRPPGCQPDVSLSAPSGSARSSQRRYFPVSTRSTARSSSPCASSCRRGSAALQASFTGGRLNVGSSSIQIRTPRCRRNLGVVHPAWNRRDRPSLIGADLVAHVVRDALDEPARVPEACCGRLTIWVISWMKQPRSSDWR